VTVGWGEEWGGLEPLPGLPSRKIHRRRCSLGNPWILRCSLCTTAGRQITHKIMGAAMEYYFPLVSEIWRHWSQNRSVLSTGYAWKYLVTWYLYSTRMPCKARFMGNSKLKRPTIHHSSFALDDWGNFAAEVCRFMQCCGSGMIQSGSNFSGRSRSESYPLINQAIVPYLANSKCFDLHPGSNNNKKGGEFFVLPFF